MRQLILYGRPDCHLCDEARAVLAPLIAEAKNVEMIERNIDDDHRLLRKFLERIPVVELDGRVISELLVDPESLCRILLNTPTR